MCKFYERVQLVYQDYPALQGKRENPRSITHLELREREATQDSLAYLVLVVYQGSLGNLVIKATEALQGTL